MSVEGSFVSSTFDDIVKTESSRKSIWPLLKSCGMYVRKDSKKHQGNDFVAPIMIGTRGREITTETGNQ